jgi:hypothetical protein
MEDSRMNSPRFNKSSIVGSLVVAAAMTAGAATADSHGHHGSDDLCDAVGHHHSGIKKALALHDDMRKLMEDHIVWTRSVIVSVVAGLDVNFGAEAGRLLQNQDDIGDAFGEYFGQGVEDHLTDLLYEHILIAAEILTTVKAGGDPTAALEEWYMNGEEIADFLHRINRRHWPRDETREMMEMHLDTTLNEALARFGTLDPDPDAAAAAAAADIAAYDEVHDHMLHMADFLTNGIIRRYPRAFR